MAEQDRMDLILKSIADEANDGVDYAAMLTSVRARTKRRAAYSSVIRIGSVAAAVAVLLLIGGRYLAKGMGANEAAPQAAPNTLMYSTAAAGAAKDEATEETQPNGDVSDTTGETPVVAAAPAASSEPAGESGDDGARSGGTDGPVAGLGDSSGAVDSGTADSAVIPDPLPPSCSNGCELFGWDEEMLDLPAIDFGSGYETASDADGFICTVSGCTDADMKGYAAALEDMYGTGLSKEKEPATSAASGAAAYRAEIDEAYYVELTLYGDTLTIRAGRSGK